MTKPAVVIPPTPDSPGILHVDTESAKYGPTPTHNAGHERTELSPIVSDTPPIERHD